MDHEPSIYPVPPLPPALEVLIEAAINHSLARLPDNLWEQGFREIVVLAKIYPLGADKKVIRVTRAIKLR